MYVHPWFLGNQKLQFGRVDRFMSIESMQANPLQNAARIHLYLHVSSIIYYHYFQPKLGVKILPYYPGFLGQK